MQILESRYFMRVQKGFLITEQTAIFAAFKKDRWFPLELLAALPLDLLALFIGVRYLSLLRVFKLARLTHLLTYSERAQAALMRHSVNAPNVRQFVTLYIALAITCHWVGCMWLLAADVGVALRQGIGWVAIDESPELRPYQHVQHSNDGGFVGYMRSMYFALTTMSTVG
jgi:Ion transport protein